MCLALLLALLPVSAAGAASGDGNAGRAPVETARLSDDAVRHVVVISVDGLNPRAIRRLGRKRLPALHRLIRQGATTLNARTVLRKTETLPNHTSMLTGRPVAGRHGHGVGFNTDRGGTVHRAAGHYVASVFDVVHNRGGSTGLYVSKDKFDLLARSWNGANGKADRVGNDNGRAKIDRYVNGAQGQVVKRLVRRLKHKPDAFSFLHLAGPDAAGHASGFLTPRYMKAVRTADRQIGRILQTVAGRPKLKRHTTVIVTSDHGGTGRGHGSIRVRDNYTVPFLAWGVAVARGKGLYSLNPDRKAPGRQRPGYRGTQPVRNADVANLVTDLLDLPKVPGSRINSPRTLHLS